MWMRNLKVLLPAAAILAAAAPAALAQSNQPEPLVLGFDFGSAEVRPEDTVVLDRASRLYRDGNPIVMVVTAGTDTVGPPEGNLELSQRRAEAVIRGLIARGIPAGRFQVVAKGETEPSVRTGDEVGEARNRRVEITWR